MNLRNLLRLNLKMINLYFSLKFSNFLARNKINIKNLKLKIQKIKAQKIYSFIKFKFIELNIYKKIKKWTWDHRYKILIPQISIPYESTNRIILPIEDEIFIERKDQIILSEPKKEFTFHKIYEKRIEKSDLSDNEKSRILCHIRNYKEKLAFI